MMEHWSEIKTDDTHAEELAVIVHEGKEFASGGFSIDVEKGRMVAYVTKPARLCGHGLGTLCGYPGCYHGEGEFELTTWGGQHLARIGRTGRSRGFYGVKLEHFSTVEPIAGYHWFGKGLGAGMVLKLKRGRKA